MNEKMKEDIYEGSNIQDSVVTGNVIHNHYHTKEIEIEKEVETIKYLPAPLLEPTVVVIDRIIPKVTRPINRKKKVTRPINRNKKPSKMKSLLSLWLMVIMIAGIGVGTMIIISYSYDSSSYDYSSEFVEEPPYHKIKFTVSDDDKDCRSDEDYFLVLVAANNLQKMSAIDCLRGEIQVISWTTSWGEGTSNDDDSPLVLSQNGRGWTTNEFYMFIGYLDEVDNAWKVTCKTPTLENGYDTSVEYCGEWYA